MDKFDKFAEFRDQVQAALGNVADEKLREQAIDALEELENFYMRESAYRNGYENLLSDALEALEQCFRELLLNEGEIEERLSPDLYEHWQDNQTKTAA